jgi:hypothetical protein
MMITNHNALKLARGKQDSAVCVATVRTTMPLLNLKELQGGGFNATAVEVVLQSVCSCRGRMSQVMISSDASPLQ